MNRAREVLRNEYIGAIAIGFLVAQAIGAAINLVMRPVYFYLERASAPKGVFGQEFSFGPLIGPAISFVLLGAIAFLLFRWLYSEPAKH